MLEQTGPVANAVGSKEELLSDLAEGLRELDKMHAEGARTDRPRKLVITEIEEWPDVFSIRGEELSEHHLTDLGRVLRNTDHLDAIVVMPCAERFVLIDGHHRLEAYRRAGRRSVPVRYFLGTPWEALEEANRLNGKARLSLTCEQRQNNAWRLTLTGRLSKNRIAELAVVAPSQVGLMRNAMRDLGETAYHCPTWRVARMMWKGQEERLLSDEERQTLREEHGQNYADRMRKEFGTRLQRNAEITAIALYRHLGDKTGEVIRHLKSLMAPEIGREEVDLADLPF